MISTSYLFEQDTFKKGMKMAGKSLLSGSGLALKGTGQAMSATGDSLHKKFSKEDKRKEQEEKV